MGPVSRAVVCLLAACLAGPPQAEAAQPHPGISYGRRLTGMGWGVVLTGSLLIRHGLRLQQHDKLPMLQRPSGAWYDSEVPLEVAFASQQGGLVLMGSGCATVAVGVLIEASGLYGLQDTTYLPGAIGLSTITLGLSIAFVGGSTGGIRPSLVTTGAVITGLGFVGSLVQFVINVEASKRMPPDVYKRWYRPPPRKKKRKVRVQLAPQLGFDGAGLALQGTW